METATVIKKPLTAMESEKKTKEYLRGVLMAFSGRPFKACSVREARLMKVAKFARKGISRRLNIVN